MAIQITPDVQNLIISTIVAVLSFFFGHKNGKKTEKRNQGKSNDQNGISGPL